jgi:uncharacterized membrane protein
VSAPQSPPPQQPQPPEQEAQRQIQIKGLRLFCLGLIMLTLCWRGWHLDQKVYWHDECFTSLVISGQPGRYFNEAVFLNKIVTPAEVLRYQQLQPELGFADTLVRQGEEDSQHPPLYYMLLRLWAQVWGTSVTAIRSFSALGSLLVLPTVYWLSIELFRNPTAAWIAVALFAVSPLQLVYAQEAREYALWMGMMLGGSTLLLRAYRLRTWQSWLPYGVVMLLGLYTALFTLLVGFGHTIYVVAIDSFTTTGLNPLTRQGWQERWQERWRNSGCLIVTGVAVGIGFLPWLGVMAKSAQRVGDSTSWAAVPLELGTAIRSHIANYSRSFVDFNFDLGNIGGGEQFLAYGLAIPILMLQLVALYWLWSHAPRRISWFLLALIAGTALPLGLRDTLRGGQLATVTRYLFPCFLGLHLTVVYWLTTYRQELWQRRLTGGLLVVLIGAGLASGMVYNKSDTWWNKVLNSNYPQMVKQINQSPDPVVVSDAFGYNPSSVIALSYLLKPEARWLLLPAVGDTMQIANVPPSTSAQAQTIFLLNLPDGFRQKFTTKFNNQLKAPLKQVFSDPWNNLWQGTLVSLEVSARNLSPVTDQDCRERAKIFSVEICKSLNENLS